MSAADLALTEIRAALDAGALGLEELLTDVLARRAASEPCLHAYAYERDDDVVLKDLRRLPAASAGPRGRGLFGIPFAVKDVIDTEDAPTEGGSAVLSGRHPSSDAPCVVRARQTGGLHLGKTRTHEFAYGVTTPPVVNPWNESRIPGGSSGGSAAAVAAGSAVWAYGTDTLGSVRMPAAMCGVVGLKPTEGLIEASGLLPLAWSLDSVGILTRTCADALLVLRELDYAAAIDGPGPASVRVGVADLAGAGAVDPGIEEHLLEAARQLSARNEVVTVDLPLLEHHVSAGFGVMVVEASSWHEPLLRRTPRGGERDYDPGIRSMLEGGLNVRGVDYLRAARARAAIVAKWAELLDRVDVVMTPATPYPAPLIGVDHITWPTGVAEPLSTSMCRFTAIANLAGLPALTVPVGVVEGLPVAVQLIGRAGSDVLLLELGRSLETRLTPPTGGSAAG